MTKNLLLSVGLLAVALIFFVGARKSDNKPSSVEAYEVGDDARDFKLKNVDGTMVSLADYQSAKGYIVIFTCNTCPFSKMYEQRIIDLDRKYKSKGFPVIAINSNDIKAQPDDSYEAMIARSKSIGYTFPYLYDETQEIASAYGATRTPHVYILNKTKNDLTVAYIGAIDNNHKDAANADKKYVEQAVDALLTGKEVQVPYTKAIGCSIKWKSS